MAIYAVLVQSIATESDIIMAIWSCVGYTVLLCFTLFKTGSLAKDVYKRQPVLLSGREDRREDQLLEDRHHLEDCLEHYLRGL